jgi:Kdo2-lipid IVA lauroyltransferase/acyltransferase
MAAASRSASVNGLYRPARGGREQVAPPRPIAAWFGVAALRSFALLPFPAIYHLAGALGHMAAILPARPVRFARITIRTCFPEMSPREQQALARRSLAESARAVCELGAFYTWKRERALGLVREVRGADLLETACAGGRGVIIAAPHLGAWELALLHTSSRLPVTALYRPPPDAALDRFYARGRTRFGVRLVPRTPGGIRTIVRALSEGQVVGIMPDQDPRRGAGVFVPFFGVLANTTTLVSRLAARSGAPVIFAFAERLADGAGFRLHFRPASPAVHDADVVVSASALNLDIERLVRACPEQYLWSYKRFSVRPAGEANPYRPVAHAETTTR